MSLPTQAGRDDVNAAVLDEKDRRVLQALQDEFPLCRSPYREIAERAGLSEEEALERVRRLRRRGVIRRIGGVLDSRKLGLTGTLVAMKVPPDRIEDVATTVNAIPNVTHNYLREHTYNMWFTLTAASPEDLAERIAKLKRDTGITEILNLPSLKTYKINVRLKFNE